jgi:hypothetical protein
MFFFTVTKVNFQDKEQGKDSSVFAEANHYKAAMHIKKHVYSFFYEMNINDFF